MTCLIRYSCIVLLLVSFSQGHATEEEITFGARYWISNGYTNWRHDASFLDPEYGVPTSELDYQGVDSEIFEFNILTDVFNDDSLRLTFGFGNINDGRLVDDDYYSALGAVNQNTTETVAHRFSRTYSDIAGDGLFYLRGDFLPHELVFNPSFGQFQISFNAQYWQENYRAQGVLQVECTDYTPPPDITDSCGPIGSFGYAGVDVISNKVIWLGFGASIEGRVNMLSDLSLIVNTTLYPLMTLINEDIHHLRTSGGDALAQNPSIRMTGTGFGYDLELGFEYRISPDLTASIAYRRWERWVKNQTITFFDAFGGSSSAYLMDFSTSRDGFIVAVEQVF